MNPVKLLGMLATLALLGGPLAGCLGGDDGPIDVSSAEQEKVDEILGEKGKDDLIEAAAIIPKNWTMPLQRLLPPTALNFTGTVTSSAVGSYEAERDEGGIDYGSVVETFDISSALPAGQPAELVIDLFWDASEANSADLDILVDVPGTRTTYSPVSETLNWNHVLKTVVVNTVGVAGQPALVGVQIASGVVGEGFEYKLDVKVTYVDDVLTPYHPWALNVPNGANAIILESVKAGGDEHITSQFVILDPDDALVKFVDFNDINIPTQSVLIPITRPGQYVFYSYFMHGGFLSVKADVPLDDNVATPLGIATEEAVLTNAPSPGVGGKDYGSPLAATPTGDDVGAVLYDVPLNDKFPLRVEGFIRGPVTADSKITLASPKGMVHTLIKKLVYEDERGTIGYTSEHEGHYVACEEGMCPEGGSNNMFRFENVDKGAWTASVVNNGPSVEVGYTVTTVQR